MTKSLYAEFTVVPGAEEQVQALIADFALKVRSEPGNVSFEPFTVQSQSRRYFVFEVYRDDHAFEQHISAPYGAEFNSALANLIEEPESVLTWLVAAG